MKQKCSKCPMSDLCICEPSFDECTIRLETYNRAIDDFVEHVSLPLTTEEQIANIIEQLIK